MSGEVRKTWTWRYVMIGVIALPLTCVFYLGSCMFEFLKVATEEFLKGASDLGEFVADFFVGENEEPKS